MTNHIVELTPDLTVTLIDPNDLPKMWADIEPLLQKACEYAQGEFTPESVVKAVLTGHYRLVAFMFGQVPQSLLVMHVAQFPTGKRALEVLLASGNAMKDWLKFEHLMVDYARNLGCSEISAHTRDGMQRTLPHWKRVAVVLTLAVDNEKGPRN